jgi:hypothetical protein
MSRRVRRPWRWWTDLKAILPPIVVYWGSLTLALSVFTGTALVTGTNDREEVILLAWLWVIAFGFNLVGQIASLLRIRTPWIATISGVTFTAFLVMITYYTNDFERWAKGLFGETGPPVLGFAMLLGGYFLLTGLWSLRVHTGVLAAWGPVVFVTGSIILLTEENNRVSEWFDGRKWAIWDLVTAPILGATVLVVVLFLAAKERHRLHRWSTSRYAPDGALSRRIRGTPNPVAGCGTVLVILLLTSILTVDSGVVGPYLWRTGTGDRDGGHGEVQQEPEPNQGDAPPEEPDTGLTEAPDLSAFPPPPDLPDITEAMKEAAKQTSAAMCMMVSLMLLTILTLMVFGPPMRRALLLQHLRHPLWPVGPTRSVRQHWRLVEIALADAGVPRKPGESSVSLARRAHGIMKLPDPEALFTSAELTDRVVYGFGMSTEDVRLAKRCAEMAYQSLYELMSEGSMVKAQYRWL